MPVNSRCKVLLAPILCPSPSCSGLRGCAAPVSLQCPVGPDLQRAVQPILWVMVAPSCSLKVQIPMDTNAISDPSHLLIRHRLQPQDPEKREKGENECAATLHTSIGSLSPHPLQERRGLLN